MYFYNNKSIIIKESIDLFTLYLDMYEKKSVDMPVSFISNRSDSKDRKLKQALSSIY